jgi:acyl-CoA thioesterase-1
MKTILVLGDSLSDGFMLPRREAYPALLAERLRNEGMDFEVINASQSGGTSSGGVSRITPHLKRKIDILVVQLGINDAFRAIPVSQIRSNLQAIITATKQRYPDCEIVIAGMQLPIETQDGYVRDFGQMYRELADKNNAALVPYLLAGVGGDPSLNLPDRIHPNAAGQKILADNVWRALEPVARRVTNDTRAAAASRYSKLR